MGELACALACTLTCPAGPRRVCLPCRRGARSWLSSPEAPGESPVARLAAPMTSPTSTVSATPRCSWSRSRLTVSTPCTRRTSSCRRSTACKHSNYHHHTIESWHGCWAVPAYLLIARCHKRYLGRRDIVLRTLNIFLLIRRGERGGSCTLLSSVERSLSVGVLIKGLWLINFTHYSIRHNNTFLQNNK